MDKREDILVRLRAIAEGIEGITNVYRNFDTPNEIDRPAIILYDADEEAHDGQLPQGHAAAGIVLATMVPQLRILIGAAPEDIGTRLNDIRRRLIAAVTSDAALAALTRRPGRIRYHATDTALGWSRTQDGDMVVRFAITYLLDPAALTA